jgi:hypothetical protein
MSRYADGEIGGCADGMINAQYSMFNVQLKGKGQKGKPFSTTKFLSAPLACVSLKLVIAVKKG